ncbi:hypothetical protein BWI17_13035 [Betaproteobacteria bacterium GR16-43]|nr:hypothetical protein BWI17_13035 [Betaproteobacteria bacterium GR16-43]
MAHRLVTACLLAAACLFPVSPASAQTISWTKSFTGVPGGWATVGDWLQDGPRTIATFPNGDLVVVGALRNGNGMVTARYSAATGAVLWSARHTGYVIEATTAEAATAVTVDPDGNVVVAGLADSYTYENRVEIVAVKYAGATGALLWSTTHGRANGTYERPYAIATNAAGDVFITGASGASTYENNAVFTIKLSGQTGQRTWTHVLPGLSYDHGTALVVDVAGHAYVGGRIGDAFQVFKLDGATGMQAWSASLPGQGEARTLVLAPGGDVLAGGDSAGVGRIVKLNPATGAVQWSQSYPNGGWFVRMAPRLDPDGNVIAAGHVASFAYVAKFSGATGAVLWGVALDSGNDFAVSAVDVDAQGNVGVTGSQSYANFRVTRLRGSDGQASWSADNPAGPSGQAKGVAVAFDAAGNLLAAGGVASGPSIYAETWRIVKYAPAPGPALWSAGVPQLPGYAILRGKHVTGVRSGRVAVLSQMSQVSYSRADRLDVVNAKTGTTIWSLTETDISGALSEGYPANPRVAMDATGNVVVTGGPHSQPPDAKMLTRKFQAASGAVAWTATSTAAAIGNAIAMDANGHVAVLGRSETDWVVAKYDGASGTRLWEVVLSAMGPSSGYQQANAIAMDSAGNVVVTGRYTNASATAGGARTFKLAAANGAILWDKLIPGEHLAVAIDAQDNVVATGDFFQYPDTFMQTVKYAPDGTELWTRLYTVDGTARGVSRALAINPQGEIVIGGYTAPINPPGSTSARIVKYSAAGVVLWTAASGAPGSYAAAIDVAFDGLGNVVAGTYEAEPGARGKSRAIKLAGATGASLWVRGVQPPPIEGFLYDLTVVRVDSDNAVLVATDSWVPDGVFNVTLSRVVDADTRPPVAVDFDGSGKADLLFENTDGRAAIWLMNGITPTATQEIIGAGTGWSVTQVADFNADGKTDLVWKHTDGRMAIYLMNGTTPATTTQLLNAGSGWSVIQTPDVDGDGKADLLFQNTDGSAAIWLMNGAAMSSGASIIGPGSGWSVTKVADFDGDGKSDLLWTHTDGRVAIWLMNGLAVKSTNQILNAASGWSVAHTIDLNGDGKADLVWQHTDGSVALWLMNGAVMASGSGLLGAGTGWSVQRVADFDGDGKGDLLFGHTDGRAAIYLMNGLMPTMTTQILNAGGGWTAKRTLDLNGDGKADIVFQNADGRTAVWLMNGTAMTSSAQLLGTGTGYGVSAVSQ